MWPIQNGGTRTNHIHSGRTYTAPMDAVECSTIQDSSTVRVGEEEE